MVNKEDYVLRISQASPAQLVVINYELLVIFLKDALEAVEDKSAFAVHTDKARNALQSLIQGLHFEITIAQNLYQIYIYIQRLLNRAYFSYDRDAIEEALSLTEILLEGWREVAEGEPEEALDNAPQVFAGLTYQRDGLSEYVVENDGRGYKA